MIFFNKAEKKMNKNDHKITPLGIGEIKLYDFGKIKLHCYDSNDGMDDQVAIVEKNGQAVMIEKPIFVENAKELINYINDMGLVMEGILLAHHTAGGHFLPEVPSYSTPTAVEYALHGGGVAIAKNFKKIFGENFDNSAVRISHVIDDDSITLGGMQFDLIGTPEAFDIRIRDINVIYVHMLGHDAHSIVPSTEALNDMIARFEEYKQQNCVLVLSGHHTPEDVRDIQIKIDYLEKLRQIVQRSSTAKGFIDETKRSFPDYTGDQYLDMTAGFLFPEV
jgi:hypothetical protein